MTVQRSPHVVVIDDDQGLRQMMIEYLSLHDMRVTGGTGGDDLFAVFERETVDLVLLDLRLRGEDGMALARALRARATVPIVVLSGLTEEADRVMSLELGADDYITKPFRPRELVARLRAVLRRYQVQATLPERDGARRAFRFAGWELNLRTRRLLSPGGAPVELSNGEFSLLSAFCRAPDRVLTRDQLLSMSRLHEGEVYDRSIDVQIRRLRLKIETDAAHPSLLVTERGAGYRLASEVEALY